MLTTQYLEEADKLADRITVIDLGLVIAEGTSDELKDQIGGEVLELNVEDTAQTAEAAEALHGLGTGEPQRRRRRGTHPAARRHGGRRRTAGELPPAGRTKIRLSGFAVHRPTLDDVFMALTGHGAEDELEPEQNGEAQARQEEGERMSITVDRSTARRAPSTSPRSLARYLERAPGHAAQHA